MNNSGSKLVLIQLFRGIAALLVVALHTTDSSQEYFDYNYLNGMFLPGWAGVDFFFVLSGFIIFYIHLKDIGVPDKLKSYTLKRLIRIYPTYWIITLLILPYFFMSLKDNEELNFIMILKSFLLFPQEKEPILRVAWTLSYEIFFYLLFGLLIAIKRYIAYFILSSWGILIVINYTFQLIDVNNKFFFYFILNPYNLEFLLGGVCGILLSNYKIKYGKYILATGILLFLVCWILTLDGYLTKYIIYSRIGFGCASFLIILGASAINIETNIKMPIWLSTLGNASYSIYLIHIVVLALTFKVLPKMNFFGAFPFVTATLSIIISVIVGVGFYITIEKKLLNFLNKKFLVSREKKVKLRSAG
ncbi:acyltransferase [Priestia megaterium]|uniref:acyltransferase family protein n=1 Tax=Priestia megaterium TaxID=1404 RepID=UPI000BFA085D|nr:acyltransferase [Priestia megaterium]PFL70515.1 acyltransferase [Priestia megaterium]